MHLIAQQLWLDTFMYSQKASSAWKRCSVCKVFLFYFFFYLLAYTAKPLQQNTFQNKLLILMRKEVGFPKDLLVILTARSFLKSSVSGSSRSSRKLYSGSSSSSNSSNRKHVLKRHYPAPRPNSIQEEKHLVYCLILHKEG